MGKILLFVALVLLGAQWGFAQSADVRGIDAWQPGDRCDEGKSSFARHNAPQVAADYPFVVVRCVVTMDWRNALDSMDWRFHGSQSITLRFTKATDTISINGAGMAIDSVAVDGIPATTTQPGNNEAFTITLPLTAAPGDTSVVTIAYTRNAIPSWIQTTPDSIGGDGFYLFNKGLYVGNSQWGDSVFLPERLAYTMSEPRDAHWWMPCVDDPSMKAPSEMRVLVPAGYSVSSNGLLSAETTTAAGTMFDWVESEPIAPYLMCASASKFSRWNAYYHPVTHPADSVPIMYFAWQVDSSSPDISGREYNATYSYRNLPEIMAGYAQCFGEYPFVKYGMTPVQPFYYGGMEHQTMTTINRVWLRGTSEMSIAHELTHQWFGDHVTCGTWKDIWLNESFATFGEAIYSEIMGGPDAYAATERQQMHDYLGSGDSLISIYDPEGQGRGVFNWSTVYRKGGTVLHMLRRVLGDTLFFHTLQAYQQHFAFGAATTQDFADFISQYTGQDLHWFVNEWVFGHGHPQYTVGGFAADSDAIAPGSVTIHVQQADTVRPLFRMPILLRVYTDRGAIDTVFLDSARNQDCTIGYGGRIDSIAFDPENSILKDPTINQGLSIWVGVADNASPRTPALMLAVAPNPVDGVAHISWLAPRAERGTLDVVDMLGRTVASYSMHGASQSVAWDTRTVPPGSYLARISTADGTASAMVRVVR